MGELAFQQLTVTALGAGDFVGKHLLQVAPVAKARERIGHGDGFEREVGQLQRFGALPHQLLQLFVAPPQAPSAPAQPRPHETKQRGKAKGQRAATPPPRREHFKIHAVHRADLPFAERRSHFKAVAARRQRGVAGLVKIRVAPILTQTKQPHLISNR